MKNKKQLDQTNVQTLLDAIQDGYEEELKSKNLEIEKLKIEIDVLKDSNKSLLNKKASISSALIEAVDKAKEIENSSKKVYELKLQHLNALYCKWEKLLDEMIQKYPNIVETKKIANMVSDFKASIINVISDDFGLNKDIETKQSSGELKELLNKIGGKTNKSTKTNIAQVTKIKRKAKETNSEYENLQNKPTKIKPIVDMTLENSDYETLADKFLNDNRDEASEALSKAVCSKTSVNDPYAFPEVNESGFDLEEAINPKDDLEQIMRSFDFFEENDNI